jgi:hypothetical protein
MDGLVRFKSFTDVFPVLVEHNERCVICPGGLDTVEGAIKRMKQ